MTQMTQGMLNAAYLVAAILFILSLGGLSHQESAARGNLFGMLGMAIALLATLLSESVTRYILLIAPALLGVGIGTLLALRVKMTDMPQLVAMLHSFVGLAAVLVGFATFLDDSTTHLGVEKTIHLIEIYVGILIGALTFTGSLLAFGKLQGILTSAPLLLPARHWLNLAILLACIYFGILFVTAAGANITPLLLMTALALLFGALMVVAIGGADMPVVISMLNSYSGWAAAATGFMLANDLLIVTGALVGASGAILSYIMCRAMNRNFFSVILGGFGSGDSESKTTPTADAQTQTAASISATDTADLLKNSRKIVIVPGYGMAVAQAQHPLSELTRHLRAQDIQVQFGIHPVAGRMPGHMNVLLAEAKVPYDIVLEMDDINPTLHEIDAILVIGANDIVNPSALEDAQSPIAGMPVLEVWRARRVIVLKRGMASGYAGVENPLFFRDNTQMLFGDAKQSIEQLLRALA